MKQKKSKKGLIIALVAVVAVLIAAFAIYFATRSDAPSGVKHITVQVVHGDSSTKDFKLNTDKEFLGQALADSNFIKGSQTQYGLYILTADNETVDEAKQEWWMVAKDGESLMVGVDSQPIADGEHYELVFTVGYGS